MRRVLAKDSRRKTAKARRRERSRVKGETHFQFLDSLYFSGLYLREDQYRSFFFFFFFVFLVTEKLAHIKLFAWRNAFGGEKKASSGDAKYSTVKNINSHRYSRFYGQVSNRFFRYWCRIWWFKDFDFLLNRVYDRDVGDKCPLRIGMGNFVY